MEVIIPLDWYKEQKELPEYLRSRHSYNIVVKVTSWGNKNYLGAQLFTYELNGKTKYDSLLNWLPATRQEYEKQK